MDRVLEAEPNRERDIAFEMAKEDWHEFGTVDGVQAIQIVKQLANIPRDNARRASRVKQ
eukprot:SAG31_NODE_13658_length_854_cov_80.468874_1_plen_59_part_00